MTTTPKCYEEVPLALTARDIWVIRQGLELLLASSTRHEHIYHDIHGAIARLPAVHEPRGDACDCFEGSAHSATGAPGTAQSPK